MSAVVIRAALEAALATVSPALATVPENEAYTPVVGTPYQLVHLLLADPADPEISGRLHTEQGFLQVTLRYPPNVGSGAAMTRAELIRSTFYRGRTFTSGSVSVVIERTPSIFPAVVEENRWAVRVRIRFYAHIVRS